MRRLPIVLAAAAAVAAVATPAAADGGRRAWRGSPFPIGAISRNVITPWYVGYHGGHYNYYKPDPMPAPVYYVYVAEPLPCWQWNYGYRAGFC